MLFDIIRTRIHGLRRDFGLRVRYVKNSRDVPLALVTKMNGAMPDSYDVGKVHVHGATVDRCIKVSRAMCLDPQLTRETASVGMIFFPAIIEANPMVALYKMTDPVWAEEAANSARLVQVWMRSRRIYKHSPQPGCLCWDCDRKGREI